MNKQLSEVARARREVKRYRAEGLNEDDTFHMGLLGVITFFRTLFPAKAEEIGIATFFPVKIPTQLGGLIAPLPHHSAKKPSLVPLCVKMAAHIASAAVKRQGRLRASALSQSALVP